MPATSDNSVADTVGSPYKRHRSSLPAGGLDGGILGAQGMSFGVGSHGGDSMFSTDTASGVMPEAGTVKQEGQGEGQTHSVPPAKQVKVEDEDEEL